MAFITSETIFNPDEFNLDVIGIASDLVLHDSGEHLHHTKAQILYAPSGCMTVHTANQYLVLPPSRLLCIPVGVQHRVYFRNVVAYRSIYFNPAGHPKLLSALNVLTVNPLLRELIEQICDWKWVELDNRKQRLLAVFWDELSHASPNDLILPLPTDYRLNKVISTWSETNVLPPYLKELAHQVGASEKTISRIFKKETGLSYQDWRLQWRLQRSIELMAEGNNVGETATELAFSSDSAFIDFFKKQTGLTPTHYFK